MMETGIYVRVSTEEQAKEGFSIRAQISKLKDYSRIKEWHVYNIYKDEGISGKNIEERPAMKELVHDVETGKINNVLVFKIDRLTRSTSDLIYLINLFNACNCAFNSLSESIDTKTANGRMFVKILGIFAEFERENIVERTKIGFERKVKEGYTLATRTASYGYNIAVGEKIQTINEFEASIVREVFDMFVNKQLTCLEIAKILNDRKIPTKENSKWYTRSIKNMLTNCNYIGKVRYAIKDKQRNFETDGVHEAIISNELYQKAQDLIKKLSVKSYTKRPKENSYFLGVLYCAKCGGKMVSHSNYFTNKNGDTIVKVDYRCRNYIKKTCDARNISHGKLEQAFREYIDKIAEFDVLNEIQLAKQQEQQENVDLLDGLHKQLKAMEQKAKETVSAYIAGTISISDYTELKQIIETEKTLLLSKIQEIEKNESDCQEEKIKKEDIIKSLKENWDLLTNSERRQFLIEFVDKIIVSNETTDNKKYSIHINNVIFHT